jgi:hypothetical protein
LRVNSVAKMESLVKERQRPRLRLLVRVVLADEHFDLLGE